MRKSLTVFFIMSAKQTKLQIPLKVTFLFHVQSRISGTATVSGNKAFAGFGSGKTELLKKKLSFKSAVDLSQQKPEVPSKAQQLERIKH